MDLAAAIYRCSGCGATRKYGHARPANGYEPLIECLECERPTRHRFVRVTQLTREEFNDVEVRVAAAGRME